MKRTLHGQRVYVPEAAEQLARELASRVCRTAFLVVLGVFERHLTKRVAEIVDNDCGNTPAALRVVVFRALLSGLSRDLRKMYRLVLLVAVGRV